MKRFITLTIMIFAAVGSIAQTIAGRITGEGKPVDYATVILQTKDSVYVASTYSDSLGMFGFKSDLTGFHLIVQHLIYETFEQTFSVTDVGSINLTPKANTLGELVIKAEHPLVTVVDGKMTYDLKQLTEGKTAANAYEALLELPGVREQDENLTLVGANGLTVIINGKASTMSSSQLTTLLKSMPLQYVKKAEVMYSAPPQYHARGAVINLILEKNDSDTPNLQGEINAGYNQKYFANYNAGGSLFYSDAKYSADFLYSFADIHSNTEADMFSKHSYNGEIFNIDQYNTNDSKISTHNIRFGNDYDINDENSVSLTYTAQISHDIKSYAKSEGTYSSSLNYKDELSPVQMHNANLIYNSGFGMTAGIDYTYYRNHTAQDFAENKPDKAYSFTANSMQDINRLKAYIDQKTSLSNNWNLIYGASFINAFDHSSQIYDSQSDVDVSDLTTDSKKTEQTYDLYAGFEKSFTDKFSMNAHVTGEYYKFHDLKEYTVFPSLEATYIFSPSHITQLTLSSNKVYPSYWEMHDAVSYLNGYTEIHGNPQLVPYKNYSSQFNYIFKSKYVLTAYYSYIDDYFAQLPYQSTDKLALIYKTTNFDYLRKAGLNLIIPFSFSILSNRLTVGGYHDKSVNSRFHDLSFDNSNFSFFAQLNNTIRIASKPDISMEINSFYISKSFQGNSQINELWQVDAGIKWSFADKKAELKFKATDVFDSFDIHTTTKYANQDLQMDMISDIRSARLTFSYKFGGETKKKERKEVDTSRFGLIKN